MFRCYLCSKEIEGAYWAYDSSYDVFVPLCKSCSEELFREERQGGEVDDSG